MNLYMYMYIYIHISYTNMYIYAYIEHDYWMGTEIGMLGGFGIQGQATAGDDSEKQGKIGAGYNNLRRKKKKQHCKVGREEEGSSSNQPELAAF